MSIKRVILPSDINSTVRIHKKFYTLSTIVRYIHCISSIISDKIACIVSWIFIGDCYFVSPFTLIKFDLLFTHIKAL